VAYKWKPTARAADRLPTPETPRPQVVSASGDRLVILYDKLDDLSLFVGEGARNWRAGRPRPWNVFPSRFRRTTPTRLPLPVWPTPRPVLVVHSPAPGLRPPVPGTGRWGSGW